MSSKHTMILVAALVLFAGNAWTQENNAVQSQSVATSSGSGEANDTNAANNPAHPLLTVDLQNYFAPSPEGFPGRIGNQGLLRVSVPIDAFGLHQFLRTILPINTTASVQGGPNTGVGDLTVYDWVLFEEHGADTRSRAAYRGANSQRRGLRFWKMAGWRRRTRGCASQLGIIGSSRYLSALLLRKQLKPGWPANLGATIRHPQPASWLLPPILGSLDV